MARLKNRQLSIPNGYRFYIPQLKWQAAPYMSLDAIARAVINLLQANPQVQAQLGWDLSLPAMIDKLDEYNAQICLQMGYKDYVLAEGGQPEPPPFLGHPSQNPSDPNALAVAAKKVKAIWSGIRVGQSWKDAGYPAVDAAHSESRASICAVCPKNGPGGLETWFTKPAAEGIRRQAEDFANRGLKTSYDEKIKTCEICYCYLKTKVHTPISFIKPETSDEVLSELRKAPACWVVKEMAGS